MGGKFRFCVSNVLVNCYYGTGLPTAGFGFYPTEIDLMQRITRTVGDYWAANPSRTLPALIPAVSSWLSAAIVLPSPRQRNRGTSPD